MAFSVSYLYKIVDKYSRPIDKIIKKTARFEGSIKRAAKAMTGFSSPMGTVIKKTTSLGESIDKTNRSLKKYKRPIDTVITKTTVLESRTIRARRALRGFSNSAMSASAALSTVAIGAGALLPVKKAMKFESVMADVSKVIDLTPKQFEAIEKATMKSALAMGKMPAGIARIAEAGGRLNIPVENMDEFIGLVSRTSVAFDMLEENAGQSIGSLQNKLGLTIKRTADLMDAVNYLADNTSAQGGRMIEIIERTSGAFGTIKMPEKFIAGWAAFADQVEVTPQLAASGLKMMINRMKLMPGMMDKLLKDPNKTMRDYLAKFQTLDAAKRAPKLLKVFGAEAGKFAELAVNRLDLLDKTLGLVSKETNYAGSMMKELQKKFGTTEFQIARVKAMFTILAITIGKSVLPAIKQLIPILVSAGKVFAKFAEAHPGLMKFLLIGGLLTAVFGAATVALGALAGAVSFLLPVFGALAAVFEGVLFFAGLIGGGVIASTVAGITIVMSSLAAVCKLVWENIRSIMDLGFSETLQIWIDMLTDLWKAIDRISVNAVTTAVSWWKDALGFDDKKSITAEKNVNMQGNLSGKIDIGTSGNAVVNKAEMKTDIPGNLGFNMGG